MTYKLLVFVLLFLFSNAINATIYYGIGAEFGFTSNNLESENFPLLNIEGRLAYKFKKNFSIEIEASASSGSSKTGNGNCSTNQHSLIICEREDEVTRQTVSVLGLYYWPLKSFMLFSSGGVGVVKSSYTSTISSDAGIEGVELIDADSTDPIVALEFGALVRKKHKVSVLWNSPYGNSETGDFSYFGTSYSYLINWRE